jgi:type III pantothenate kinase
MESDLISVLAIDAGNTRIKWALHDGTAWIARGTLPTAEAQDVGALWSGFAAGTRAIAANVAGDAVGADMGQACAKHGLELAIIASRHAQLGVTNGYRDPAQLGADRWAALIAAHHSATGHKLVVSAGTALTIDALCADGRFLGGLIVPGPALMRRSLDRGTAGLRLTEGAFDPFPRSTPDAITTGALQAAIGALARMREAMAQRGFPADRLILSGGAAAEIEPHLPMPATLNDNLVLDGLALIAREA